MTRASAPMGMAFRALLVGGGVVLIVLGIAALFFAHNKVVDLTGTTWLAARLGLRAVEAALVWAGTWCCVRGWNGRPQTETSLP
ncbi:hypothetical protein [Streptomyces sp. NPDC053079]|uniref:hypothetical protein n=1 Tax=Streptomyces sp. NPDC053079 TaxID=3365697 RepID=UPI0037CFB116